MTSGADAVCSTCFTEQQKAVVLISSRNKVKAGGGGIATHCMWLPEQS